MLFSAQTPAHICCSCRKHRGMKHFLFFSFHLLMSYLPNRIQVNAPFITLMCPLGALGAGSLPNSLWQWQDDKRKSGFLEWPDPLDTPFNPQGLPLLRRNDHEKTGVPSASNKRQRVSNKAKNDANLKATTGHKQQRSSNHLHGWLYLKSGGAQSRIQDHTLDFFALTLLPSFAGLAWGCPHTQVFHS